MKILKVKMKNFKLMWKAVSILMFAVFLITSCQKEEVTSPTASTQQNETIESFNKLFTNGTIDQIFEEVKSSFSFENIADYTGETFDNDQVNETLAALGKPEMDFQKYTSEYQSILANDNATNKDLISFLYRYGFYTSSQLFHLEKILDSFIEARTQQEFNEDLSVLSSKFKNDSSLNDFDINTLALVVKVLGIYNIDEEYIFGEQRGACWDCMKDKKKKIWGWGAVTFLILLIGCILLSLPLTLLLTVGCIIGATSWGSIVGICTHCFNACSWC